jgi:hypothetical protein
MDHAALAYPASRIGDRHQFFPQAELVADIIVQRCP